MVLSKKIAYTLIVKIIIVASSFITSIISARILGPAGRGEFAIVTSTALLIANFSFLGLNTSNTYFFIKFKQSINDIIINSLWICLLGGIVGLIVCIIVGLNWIYFIIIFLYVFSIMLYIFTYNLLIAKEELKHYSIQDLFTPLLMLLSYSAGFILKVDSVIYYVCCNLLASVCTALYGIRYFGKDLQIHDFSFNFPFFKKSIKYGYKVYLTFFIYYLIMRGGLFLLTHEKLPYQVGYYSIGIQILDIANTLAATIAAILFPKLLTKTAENRRLYTIKILLYLFLFLLFMIICIYFTIDYFILTFLGKSFIPVIPIVTSLLPCIVFLGLNSIISQKVASDGYPAYSILFWFLGFTVFISISLWLMPMGAIGIARALSAASGIIFTCFFLKSIVQKVKI